jgi:hypothetical protein
MRKRLRTTGETGDQLIDASFSDPDIEGERLLSVDAQKRICSTKASEHVSGTENRITIAEDANGDVTLNAPQDLHTGAAFHVNSLQADALSASRLLMSDGDKKLSSAEAKDFVQGTSNRITATDDGAGGVTLSTPQDLHTAANVQFANVTGNKFIGSSGNDTIIDTTATDKLIVFKNAGTTRCTILSDGSLVCNGAVGTNQLTSTSGNDLSVNAPTGQVVHVEVAGTSHFTVTSNGVSTTHSAAIGQTASTGGVWITASDIYGMPAIQGLSTSFAPQELYLNPAAAGGGPVRISIGGGLFVGNPSTQVLPTACCACIYNDTEGADFEISTTASKLALTFLTGYFSSATADHVNQRLIASVAGVYRATMRMAVYGPSGTKFGAAIYKNGSATGGSMLPMLYLRTTPDLYVTEGHFTLAANDYVEVFVVGNGSYTSIFDFCFFHMERIGA